MSSASLYGGTYNLLHYTLPKLGVDVTFVNDPDNLDEWRAAIRPETRAFYGEAQHGGPEGAQRCDVEFDRAHRCAGYPDRGSGYPQRERVGSGGLG